MTAESIRPRRWRLPIAIAIAAVPLIITIVAIVVNRTSESQIDKRAETATQEVRAQVERAVAAIDGGEAVFSDLDPRVGELLKCCSSRIDRPGTRLIVNRTVLHRGSERCVTVVYTRKDGVYSDSVAKRVCPPL